MKTAAWNQALETCADPERARHFLTLLAATDARPALEQADPEQARILAAVCSGSLALSNLLVAYPAWLAVLEPERLAHPRREQGLRRELADLLQPQLAARDFAGACNQVRQFQRRELLRVAARDLARLSHLPEIIREVSDVADVCLGAVYDLCREQLAARYGSPWHQDADGRWQQTGFCILGLGKLGGQELNYSSDVDLIFVYSEEGGVFKEPPTAAKPPGLGNHQYFTRLAEAFVAEVTRLTPAGTLYRVDLRLRPEGDAGPLVRSLPSCENSYAQWGQTWERLMLMKTRRVAGDAALGAEFIEMVNTFRHPRSLGQGVLREIAAMKDRIETEVVKAGELDRNVKLGRGGIREIEFVVQTLQLLHGGHLPFLQNPETLPTLEKLAQYKFLSADEAQALARAYAFLRDVEHRLQMEDNRQTHTIPETKSVQDRLARLMGCATRKAFNTLRGRHTAAVRTVYDRLLRGGAPATRQALPTEFAGAEAEWKQLLAGHSFRDVDTAFRVVREFVEGPGYVHVSPRTTELARELLLKFFALCRHDGAAPSDAPLPPKTLSDPDRVVTRLDSFISAYGARATLFELWNSNPHLFELLLLLFDRSEFLAETAIRVPDLVDELVISGRLRQRKSAADILRDLRHGLADADQRLWLRRYHQAEQMRIGLRDILDLAAGEQVFGEISALADACLQYAVDVTLRKHRLRTPPFVIVGLGKLGGQEIDYGSDLDIVFVAKPRAQNLVKLQRLAVEIMDLLSDRTEQGLVFHTDARLRPDGEKGLLVNTLDAFEDYYRRRAALWEIQSLTRTRPLAGDLALGAQFQQLAAALADFRPDQVAAGFPLPAPETPRTPRPKGSARRAGLPGGTQRGLAAYVPDWKGQIHRMRLRIEKERTPAGKDDLAIKTGRGGLMDAEFIAQALCLAQGWQEANTLRALERARQAGALAEPDKLIDNYRRLQRLEGILRRWSFEGEVVLPDDPAPYYRVAVRCGFATPEQFRAALAGWRQAIREVYTQMWPGESPAPATALKPACQQKRTTSNPGPHAGSGRP